MTVHVLIPVFNRLSMTRTVLEQLRQQSLDEPLTVTVVDDGSTDGTGEYLTTQADVKVLSGNGHLWWGGAIDLGLRQIVRVAAAEDWVLFVNNDTEIRPDFIRQLLTVARSHAPAAVGSVVRDIMPPHQLLSVGPCIDAKRFTVKDMGEDALADSVKEAVAVDALSGRGVLFPVAALRTAGGMRPRWLPQYLGDYELSLRVREGGWRLLVARDAVVYSHRDFGSSFRARSLRDRLFSVRSPTYLPAQMAFWWRANDPVGRLSLPLRLMAHFARRQVFRRPQEGRK